MAETQRKILEELSKHVSPVKYSTLRRKFEGDSSFLEQLQFLISTEDVMVAGWDEKKSKYPTEAAEINRTHQQVYSGEREVFRTEDKKNIREYVKTLLTARKRDYTTEEIDKTLEPCLILRTNIPAYLKKLEKGK
jgi:hypothetical protein